MAITTRIVTSTQSIDLLHPGLPMQPQQSFDFLGEPGGDDLLLGLYEYHAMQYPLANRISSRPAKPGQGILHRSHDEAS
jgi:hypothetical protein